MNYKTSILARMLYLLSVMLLLLLILVSTYNSTSSPDLPNIQLQYKPVSITGNTYYLITQDGTLLVWGENINDFDSLGKEFVINGSITAKPIASDVTAVFSGRFDLLALNRSGELLGWYRFAYSKALGKYQDIKQANIPRILLNDVVSADIGLSHYLAPEVMDFCMAEVTISIVNWVLQPRTSGLTHQSKSLMPKYCQPLQMV